MNWQAIYKQIRGGRVRIDIDSYDFLNFLIGLNETIGVNVPESDYGKLRTLQEMVSYLSARRTK